MPITLSSVLCNNHSALWIIVWIKESFDLNSLHSMVASDDNQEDKNYMQILQENIDPHK